MLSSFISRVLAIIRLRGRLLLLLLQLFLQPLNLLFIIFPASPLTLNDTTATIDQQFALQMTYLVLHLRYLPLIHLTRRAATTYHRQTGCIAPGGIVRRVKVERLLEDALVLVFQVAPESVLHVSPQLLVFLLQKVYLFLF
jgi:hypothetical protein